MGLMTFLRNRAGYILVFAIGFAIVAFYNFKFKSGGIIMFVNILMNLYPSLLQQENKRRIDQFINKF